MVTSSDRRGGIEDHAAAGQSLPAWFEAFLADRGTGKPSAHTMKAYRQDFVAIAMLLNDRGPAGLELADITKDSMRAAFAVYARTHEADRSDGAGLAGMCCAHFSTRRR